MRATITTHIGTRNESSSSNPQQMFQSPQTGIESVISRVRCKQSQLALHGQLSLLYFTVTKELTSYEEPNAFAYVFVLIFTSPCFTHSWHDRF